MDIDHDTETDWYSAAKEKRIQDSIDDEDETPQTNAVWRKHVGFSPQSAADAYELAGNLERQLAEAREKNAKLVKDMILHERMADGFMDERDRLAKAIEGLLENYKLNHGKGLGIGPRMRAKKALAAVNDPKTAPHDQPCACA